MISMCILYIYIHVDTVTVLYNSYQGSLVGEKFGKFPAMRFWQNKSCQICLADK